jgi:NTE family protein
MERVFATVWQPHHRAVGAGIVLLRQVADPGDMEGASWAGMRIHRVASDLMVDLGYSSKLNPEWDFLCMSRDVE